ncbi:histidine phosphatase family protein [Wenxinia marina]|uniref:Fructose-2,6-bisphosphatase n=1 Tax=Wenxinia marina DSM 24838 TaxID=1123501 RepID=A0A0D0NK80_9RHOB|nr:histidine phosphatase family protein [Wenxinia marina]KIQ68710.1 Fructose-2,6-bisphosphatase [Wenxinia marina DSM 24838]GGL65860.1 phosphoglycerate mutase [Wenxinia marina]
MLLTPPDLYVVRHGETEWNRIGRWQGPLDSALTPRGEAQARAMGRLLAEMGVTPATHRFDVSPQGRARRTAELILNGAGEARVDDRLREIGVGAWAGRNREEIRVEAGLGPDAHFLALYEAAPGGEPFEALLARVTEYLKGLDRPTVAITHGVTSRFLRTAALGLGLDRVAEVPGGQGVIHHVAGGAHRTLDAGEPGDAA